jgi:hypothetical protein
LQTDSLPNHRPIKTKPYACRWPPDVARRCVESSRDPKPGTDCRSRRRIGGSLAIRQDSRFLFHFYFLVNISLRARRISMWKYRDFTTKKHLARICETSTTSCYRRVIWLDAHLADQALTGNRHRQRVMWRRPGLPRARPAGSESIALGLKSSSPCGIQSPISCRAAEVCSGACHNCNHVVSGTGRSHGPGARRPDGHWHAPAHQAVRGTVRED